MTAIAFIVVMMAFVVLILMPAVINDSDAHYQHVGIAQLVEPSANSIISGEVTRTDSTAVVGVTIRNPLGADFAPNAFGKDRHGAHVWDVKQFNLFVTAGPTNEANQNNDIRMVLSSDKAPAVPLTSLINPSVDGWIVGEHWNVENLSTASGESAVAQLLQSRQNQPMDIIDGNSFHNLLTQARYACTIQGTGNSGATTGGFGMMARRVTVPLTEVFFDRDTIEGLLDGIVLSAILGTG